MLSIITYKYSRGLNSVIRPRGTGKLCKTNYVFASELKKFLKEEYEGICRGNESIGPASY